MSSKGVAFRFDYDPSESAFSPPIQALIPKTIIQEEEVPWVMGNILGVIFLDRLSPFSYSG
jgi:hypothetical protein